MKTLITLTTTLLVLTFFQTIHAQTFVNAAATGNNDGTSWEDAFNDLQDALANVTSGDQIWVSTGTYLPGTTDAATFHLTTDIQLYGGFAGTESNLSERDIENNPTILSGDLNGDDVIDDFLINRMDNANNIMFIESTTTHETIIDGFIFEGGHADSSSGDLNATRGGGVWSLGPAQFQHCTFRQNFAVEAGGGVYFRDQLSEGGKVLNCTFECNAANERGAGLTVSMVLGEGIIVDSCQFTNNRTTVVGGGIIFASANGEVINSHFDGNFSTLAAGAVYISRSTNSGESPFNNILNCTFENNESSNAGALGFQSLDPGQNYQVKNCSFVGNSVSELIAGQSLGGGALFFFNFSNEMTALVDSCQFENNESAYLGGALTFYETETSSDNQIEVRNSSFQSNKAMDGGAFSFFSNGIGNSKVQISACTFSENMAILTTGGNQPDGGALYFEYGAGTTTNDTLLVNDCLLENNTGGRYGGGINFFNSYGIDNHLEINNCEIFGNATSATGEGGGITITEGAITSSVLIRNTHFSANTAEEVQGVFIRTSLNVEPSEDSHVEFLNCLFTDHNPNSSGAIVTAAQNAEYILTNCTFADNDCSAAALYASQEDTKLTLQNTILQSGSYPDLFIIPGLANSDVQSLGGNLIGSNALDAYLNSTDQSAADPLFESGTYQLSQNSPAVDAGILLDNPTATDFAGNDRIQGSCIDIGAFESSHDAGTNCQMITSNQEVIVDPSAVLIYPNPVSTLVNISIENDWRGEVQVDIINVLGQRVFTTQLTKVDEKYTEQIMIDHLRNGNYQLMLSNNQKMMVKVFSKIGNK